MKTPYTNHDGYTLESEELCAASTMRCAADAWSELSAAFTPRCVSEVTFPYSDKKVYTAEHFEAQYKRIAELADILENTGDPSLKECAVNVRAAIAPYREKLEKHLAENAGL